MNESQKYTALMVSPETRETVRAEARASGMKIHCLVDRMVSSYIEQRREA